MDGTTRGWEFLIEFVWPIADASARSPPQLLISWSHRGRVRNEAAFAALAGAVPLEASSGQKIRHRLNRGGDRDLNRALHTIAITRLRCHPESRAYKIKRTAQGKTHGDVRRSLKRALARRLYRRIQPRPAHRAPHRHLTNIGASNRLLRQYLPRHVSLRDYSQADLDDIAAELNGRPRHTLTSRQHSRQ